MSGTNLKKKKNASSPVSIKYGEHLIVSHKEIISFSDTF